jgi:RNA polymerase sigma-70 factor (ECF subfamily)
VKGDDILTDNEIVELFLARRESAIRETDTKYGSRLKRFGERITEDSHTAEECVDDTYLKAWQTIPPKEPRSYLFAFLSKILRNVCLDRLRTDGRIKRGGSVTVLSDELTEAAPSGESADSEVMRAELAMLITRFLTGIKEEQRQIFVMRYFYMESVEEISKKLKITEGKVKTVLKRARDKLKLFLEVYGYLGGGK